jgi:glycosyltransferase involved in cell wall biosynthesis
VEDGVNGFLVPLGDVGALSEALEQLIGSKKLREKMGEESYKKAEAYSLERILKEMEGIYRKFLERYA